MDKVSASDPIKVVGRRQLSASDLNPAMTEKTFDHQ